MSKPRPSANPQTPTQYARHYPGWSIPDNSELHWRDESHARRQHITETIAGMNTSHVAVRAEAEATKQERARRKCLAQLLYDLDQRHVTSGWLESRHVAQDRRDQESIATLHGPGAVASPFGTAYATPINEPRLWVPRADYGAARRYQHPAIGLDEIDPVHQHIDCTSSTTSSDIENLRNYVEQACG